MMTAIWILLVLVTVTNCQQPLNKDVILSYKNENNHDGSYKYSYETSNGISVEEEGSLKNPGTDQEAQTARGSYSYTAPDGQVITVNWYADETGFHAEGSHIHNSASVLFPPIDIRRAVGSLKSTSIPRPNDISVPSEKPRPTDIPEAPIIPPIAPPAPLPEFFRG